MDYKETGLWVLALIYSAVTVACVSHGPQNLTVTPGDDAILLCEDLNHIVPFLLVCSRPELKSVGFVYFDRGDGPMEIYQLSSYRGRVELRVPHMKDGNMSVALKNATMNDTGTYECRIGKSTSGEPVMIRTINLKVEDSGHTAGNTRDRDDKDGGTTDGSSRGHVGLVVAVLVFVCVVVMVMVIYKRKTMKNFGADCNQTH